MMKLKSISIILICLVSNYMFSQSGINPKFPELFKSLPSFTKNLEDWHIKMYSNNPNLFDITLTLPE